MTSGQLDTESDNDMDRILLTPEEVAEALHVGRCTVYDLIRTNQLQSLKIGKLRRIPVEAVYEFARRMLDEGGDAA
jgi:excisionase family DNA binding protein